MLVQALPWASANWSLLLPRCARRSCPFRTISRTSNPANRTNSQGNRNSKHTTKCIHSCVTLCTHLLHIICTSKTYCGFVDVHPFEPIRTQRCNTVVSIRIQGVDGRPDKLVHRRRGCSTAYARQAALLTKTNKTPRADADPWQVAHVYRLCFSPGQPKNVTTVDNG